jgi:hypothetical protein
MITDNPVHEVSKFLAPGCEEFKYHVKKRQLPGCCFPKDAEGTYDRSFERFAKLVMEKRV